MNITISGGDLLSLLAMGILTKEDVRSIIFTQYPIPEKKSE